MSNTFKIGDRVISREYEWTNGLVGTVYKTEDGVYAVEFDNGGLHGWSRTDPDYDGPCWWLDAADMELITSDAHQPFQEPVALAGVSAPVRTFDTGATRDTDEDKLDFEGFLSPVVLEAYAEYMHGKRKMPDGSLRDSDNWQKGIPLDAYMKSMWRHFFAVWKGHREGYVPKEDLLALLFNVQGYAHEHLTGYPE